MAAAKAFWQDVRQAYEHSNVPVITIAKRFGIAKSTLLKHARTNGWKPRRERRTPGQQPRDNMIRRLHRTIDLKLAQLEARMQNDKDITVADHEREIRAIGQLIRNFEKVSDLESSKQDGASEKCSIKAAHQDEAEQLDPHHLREELAQRILRLRAKQIGDS